jgi:TolB-like protein
MKQRFDEAIAEFKIGEVNGLQGLMAYAHSKAGRKTEARQMLEATKKLLAQRGDMDNVWLTCAYIGMGEKDRAIACLEQDCENHATAAVALKSNPLLDPLRSEPRFIELMHRVHLTPGQSAASEIVPEKSIAVLPFENLSDDKAHPFFADGVQDDILTKLAKVADLKVISRTSVMQYRGKHDMRQIGRELVVAHVLEGTVRRSGMKVHVNAQLVDARTNTHVWAEEYDRDLNDVFAIEAELAQSIASQLRANVSTRETLAIQQRPTPDLVAYDLYTRAKNLIPLAGFGENGKQDLLAAADLLNEAVRHDPSFFDAYCQLARAHDRIYSRGYDRTRAPSPGGRPSRRRFASVRTRAKCTSGVHKISMRGIPTMMALCTNWRLLGRACLTMLGYSSGWGMSKGGRATGKSPHETWNAQLSLIRATSRPCTRLR